ncbi:hypothetical protein NKH77_26830 [Streptomyces sp. M19]
MKDRSKVRTGLAAVAALCATAATAVAVAPGGRSRRPVTTAGHGRTAPWAPGSTVRRACGRPAHRGPPDVRRRHRAEQHALLRGRTRRPVHGVRLGGRRAASGLSGRRAQRRHRGHPADHRRPGVRGGRPADRGPGRGVPARRLRLPPDRPGRDGTLPEGGEVPGHRGAHRRRNGRLGAGRLATGAEFQGGAAGQERSHGAATEGELEHAGARPAAGRGPRRFGGTSFNDANRLSTGAWQDEIRPGETRFYKVPVDWGQQVFAAAELPSAAGKSGGAVGEALGVRVYNPPAVWCGTVPSWRTGKKTSAEVGTAPVAYGNRYEKADASVRAASFTGWYYLAVTLHSKTAPYFTDAAPSRCG